MPHLTLLVVLQVNGNQLKSLGCNLAPSLESLNMAGNHVSELHGELQ